jgi:hypothetical protein
MQIHCVHCGELLEVRQRQAWCPAGHGTIRCLSHGETLRMLIAIRKASGSYNKSPGRPPRLLEIDGECRSIGAWAADSQVPVSAATIRQRLRRHWQPDEAVRTPPLPRGCYLGKPSSPK